MPGEPFGFSMIFREFTYFVGFTKWCDDAHFGHSVKFCF